MVCPRLAAVGIPCQKSRSEAQLTAQSPPALPAELSDWPVCTLGEAQLGDLELLTSGAFAPLRGFMDAADVAAVTERGMLADGTPWSVPVTLDVPAGVVPADADRLVLQDQEGSPLAVLSITERLTPPGAGDDGTVRLAGPVTPLREPEHGPFRQLRRRPEDVRAELADAAESSGDAEFSPAPAATCSPTRPGGPSTSVTSVSCATTRASSTRACWCCPWSAGPPRS